MHDHILNKDGPGTNWNPAVKNLILGRHLTTSDNLFSAAHYHLYVKCGYAAALVRQTSDLPLWSKLYDKMQMARVGYSNRKKYDELLASISRYGFDHRFPIPVSRDRGILDGSHRIAGSFVLGVNPSVELYAEASHSYDRTWFESTGFTTSELTMIDAVREKIGASACGMENISVGVVWGCALEHWNEIFSMLDKGHLQTAYCIDLANPLEMITFVMRSYQGDGMPSRRILEKGRRLAKASTKVGIFALKGMLSDEINSLKVKIRDRISPKMQDYFFDNIVHILDCRRTAGMILSEYGNSPRRD